MVRTTRNSNKENNVVDDQPKNDTKAKKPKISKAKNDEPKNNMKVKGAENMFKLYGDDPEDNLPGRIGPNGMLRLFNDLQIDPSDRSVLILAWKLKAATQCEFSKDEWIQGMEDIKADNMEKLSKFMKNSASQIKEPEDFKQFYQFSFTYAKPLRSTGLDLATAVAYWQIIFGKNQRVESWISFLQNNRIRGKKGVPRPFGDAWLDGVDLFLEHGAPADRYDVLARELAKHNVWAGPGKLLHLTATVPCRFPPAGYMKRALDTGMFERIHMRAYGDDGYCGAYWELAWDKWTAAYSGTLIYIGLPASMQVSGWVHPKDVYYGVAPVVQKAPNYGGFMLWDRYYDKQDNYSSYIMSYA